MTSPGPNPHLFRWRRLGESKTADKMHAKTDDIDQWRKRVEAASEFAVSEVFTHKKPHSGKKRRVESLQSSEQLRDHDDAYSEAQALLADWLNSKLNFDDLYNCLAEEEEHSAVNSFLHDLMEQELLDSEVMEELVLDVGQTRKKLRNPIVSMEARHLQVRENRARREAERLRQQREGEALRELVRQRERVRVEGQRGARSLQPAPPLPTKQLLHDTERRYQEKRIQAMIDMRSLKCLQRHFSGWYSVVLDRRLRLGKVTALCDWKRQLRAWRAWRAVLWAGKHQREVTRTEEDLRAQNRQCQLAVESDRRRLLGRCLNDWQLWCRMEKEKRELLAQQQETRSKMAALINAASTGKLKAKESPNFQPIMELQAEHKQPGITEKEGHPRSKTLAPDDSSVHRNQTPVGVQAQPWQVTRRHAAPSASELHGSFSGSKSAAASGSRFENRHAVQQQIISQQRRLLKEQQEQISRLRDEQSMKGLELEMEKTAQLTQLIMTAESRTKSNHSEPTEQRTLRTTEEPVSFSSKKAVRQQTRPCQIITAMEERARQREERRKEIEELRRKKEDEKLAEMKRKREERRQEREREEEKQRQLKRQQELLSIARQHYLKNLQLRRGLAPWKRFIQLQRANIKLADTHHNLSLLRRSTLRWQQSARESSSQKEARADRLHRHFLLRRSLSRWKRLMDWRMIQEERAERFHRARTLRRFLLALLDHVTQERLLQRDRQEHNDRRVLRRCLQAWRQLPCLQRRERVREERREKLGRRVAAILPDFCSHPL
ncbi:Coiled-coil domain containing protein 191 [Dissostichus eleginoides]|uniref:Coiled-coil domain containing protein 191 n=1 Tax=Dissostichus eleginoides TaxID=100907 RepID=A0AAD9BK65_DISEL|nr:Coiled-coil domain containing protein 191 [Dissostichus eleginoides]